jgi:type III secretion protein J
MRIVARVRGALLRRGVLLALCAALAGCGGSVELVAQISEAQANEVLAALMPRGIAAEKVAGKEGLVSVQVPQDKVAQAIEILQSEGLPHAQHASMGEVFKKDGLISSPLEERARLVYALSQELAATISKIDGVVDAEVHVVLPERGGFGEQGNPSSAAVFIKYEDTMPVDNVVPQIRRLVANSISGLSYDHVSVVLVPTAPQEAAAAAPPAARTLSVLGIEVAPRSAGPLRAILGGLAVLLLGAAAAITVLFVRGRAAPAPAPAPAVEPAVEPVAQAAAAGHD